MLKKTVNSILILLMLTNPVTSNAGRQGARYPGGHGCNRELVRKIIDEENSHYADLVRQHIEERKEIAAAERRAYDKKFCDALQENWDNGRTEARYECLARDCRPLTPTPQNVDDHRAVVDHVRPPSRRPLPPPPEDDPPPRETASGGLGNNSLLWGIGGLAVGGLLGYMLGQRGQNNHHQHQQPMFPPPRWGGQWGQPGGMPPGVMPFPGSPGVMPFPGQGGFSGVAYPQPFGQTNPWAQPYLGGVNQFAGGYNQYNYGAGQFGGGYRGPAPSVLPLAPQAYSPYSVGGSIPQNHWNLINVGR